MPSSNFSWYIVGCHILLEYLLKKNVTVKQKGITNIKHNPCPYAFWFLPFTAANIKQLVSNKIKSDPALASKEQTVIADRIETPLAKDDATNKHKIRDYIISITMSSERLSITRGYEKYNHEEFSNTHFYVCTITNFQFSLITN
jgi:hypothetical protein